MHANQNANSKKVLLFIKGGMPTEADYAQAQALGGNVIFRNADAVEANPAPGQIETCDIVASGQDSFVPLPYWNKFPHVEGAVQGSLPTLPEVSKPLAPASGDVPPIPASPVPAAPLTAPTPSFLPPAQA